MAKSRNFSVRAQAISALLDRFSPEHYAFEFIGCCKDYKPYFDTVSERIESVRNDALYHRHLRARLDGDRQSSDFGDPDLETRLLDLPKVLVNYTPRRPHDEIQVLSIFTSSYRILGLIYVDKDGKATYSPMGNHGGNEKSPPTLLIGT